ncbi:unnamed protein product [Acidocella sp. C78]|nr:unnamed protein product [Acidocella sp. C78]
MPDSHPGGRSGLHHRRIGPSCRNNAEDFMPYEMIITETDGAVAFIRLNRPEALNALCDQLMTELGDALRSFDADAAIRCIVLTGSERAFAAGADIKEMADRAWPATGLDDFIGRSWEVVTTMRKPVIAAVAGYALGGGCELAMMCDIILAADTAKFGQPEIAIGVIPGAGGTQRLTRAIGKSKAMEMILTGRMMDAEEAERANLVARVVPAAELMAEATKLAKRIAGMSPVALLQAKRSINAAFETTLSEGVKYERAAFLPLFGTPHQREGMQAFIAKRKPDFA